MSRLAANREIVRIIAEEVEKYPDWRFHQILQNINVNKTPAVDQWYEESEDTLKRVVKL